MLDKIKSAWAVAVVELKDVWNRGKMFIIAILAIIGAIEFQKIRDFILLYLAKREMDGAKKEDQSLANQESKANDEADKLIKEAEDLPKHEKPVDNDWFKK